MAAPPTHPPLFEHEGKSLMLQVSSQEIARYVIIAVRDPLGYEDEVAAWTAGFLDDARLIADTKMFITFSGSYKGVPVTVCSTGSGAPETELALVDFFRFTDADTFIRLGTSGTYREDINVGDIVIAAGAVRDDGTSAEYVKTTYPALASYEVVLALAEAAEHSSFNYHIGITRSNDSCLTGQGRPMLEYWQEEHRKIPEYWNRVGIMNFERETSTTYVLSSLMGYRAGAVNSVVNSTPKDSLIPGAGKNEAVMTVLDGISVLAEWDKQKEDLKKRYWLPSMSK
jgi:uridine phosphorylase